jgi:hypothetical protein
MATWSKRRLIDFFFSSATSRRIRIEAFLDDDSTMRNEQQIHKVRDSEDWSMPGALYD